jgi:flagellar protein FliO/FliZ
VTASPSIWPALTAFAAVLALIPIALWLLKRLQSSRLGAPQSIAVTGGLSLGPRERIVIVESEGRRFMIGVTSQSISLISELDRTAPASTPVDLDPASAAANASAQAAAAGVPAMKGARPFSELLERIKRHD